MVFCLAKEEIEEEVVRLSYKINLFLKKTIIVMDSFTVLLTSI